MSLSFNGSTQYGRNTSAPATTFPLTLRCLFSPTAQPSGGADMAPVSLVQSAGLEEFWISYFDDAGTIKVRAVTQGGGAVRVVSKTQTLTLGAWYDLTAVFTVAGTTEIYVDNVAGGNVDSGGTPTPAGISDFYVGAFHYNTVNLYAVCNGRVAEAAVWTAALTADDRAALAAKVSPLLVQPQALVAYAPLLVDGREIVGTRHLTLTASPAVADHAPVLYPRRRGALSVTADVAPATPVSLLPAGLFSRFMRTGRSGLMMRLRAPKLIPQAPGSGVLAGLNADSNTTDERDPTASSAAVALALASDTTAGLDFHVAALAATVGAASATTDERDTLVASMSAAIAATSSTTDERDPVASSAGAALALNSNTTDERDVVSAASGQPALVLDSNTADERDVVASAGAAALALASALTDERDPVAAAAAAALALASDTTDGRDPVAAASSLALALAAALQDGFDTLSAAAAETIIASLASLDGLDTVASASVLAPIGGAATISPQHHAWLEALARVHGLVDPLAIGPTGRSDGTLVQSVAGTGPVVVTTLSGPTGAITASALTPQEAAWLEQLVRAYGVIDPLTVTAAGRSDGTLSQTFSVAGAVTTVSTP